MTSPWTRILCEVNRQLKLCSGTDSLFSRWRGTVLYLSDHSPVSFASQGRQLWKKSSCLQECWARGCRMQDGLHSQCQCMGLVPAHQLCGKTSSHQWWAIIAYVNQNDIKPIPCSQIRFYFLSPAYNSALSASISVVSHINTDYWG